MTDDIVTRLREQVDCSQQLMCYAPRRRLDRLSHEAADEIERLRAALRDIALFSPYKHSSTLRRKARAALKEGEASHD